MAMNLDTAIRLTAQVQGAQNLKGMAAQFQQLNATAQISGRQLDRLYTATQQFSRAAGGSINSLQQQRSALETLRNAVDPASRRFQLLTRDIDNLDRRLQGLTRTSNAAKAGLSGLNVREALGGAAGAAALGGGPGAAIGALGGSLAAAGTTAGIAAAAGVAAAAGLTVQSIASARALEEQARRLRVMTEEGDILKQQIIALTREQGHLISTTEASAAAYDILQAGFSKSSDILSILKASTLGATAGFTDVKTVADATTSILNGYGLAAAEAGRVVDQMKASTDDGKISMEAYSQSIGRVVPSSAAAKIPLEEVNAAISALTAQGVPVETTFSGINQAIKTILNPTKEARDLAKQLGLQFDAQAVAAKGLGGFLADVAAKTGKSSDALSVLFSDIDGYKAVVGLLNDDLRRFNQFTDNQAKAIGRSAEATEKAIDPIKRFDNSWKDFTSTLGTLVLPTLEKVVNNSTKLLQGLLGISNQLKEVGKWGAWAVNQLNPLTPGLLAFDGLSKLMGANQSNASSRSQQFGPPIPDRLRSSAISGQADTAAAARATALAKQLRDGQSVASGAARSVSGSSTFQPSSRARALMAAAKELGISPLDLATIISFETGGSFNPSLFGGAGGNYMGLIQFGPTERRQYGARQGQSFEEQVTGPVVRYFKDRFSGVGMSTQGASLLDLYTTVLAGNPRASRTVRDSFGTSPSSGVARMGPHRQKALQTFFGGSMANVGFDALDQAEAINKATDYQLQKEEEIKEQQKQQLDRSVAIKQEKLRELYLLESVDELQRLERRHEIDRLKRVETYRDLIHSSMTDQERINHMEAQAAEARSNQVQYEENRGEILKKQEEERLKLAQARLDVERNLADVLEESIAYMTELSTRGSVSVGLQQGLSGYVEQLGTMRDATAQLTQQGIRGLEDSLVSLATTGKANWREFTVSVLEGTARMIIQQMVLAPLMRAIGGIGGGIAQSFQMPPQYFLPAGGFSFEGGGYTGSGARSGGMDGRGGFLAMLHPRETVIDHTKANAAGGNTTVVVNINTTTGETQTQATDADRRRLGQDIAQVVDARLVYHKRQGGMLSGRR